MELHVFIEVMAPIPEAYVRMAHAMDEVKKFLIPVCILPSLPLLPSCPLHTPNTVQLYPLQTKPLFLSAGDPGT